MWEHLPPPALAPPRASLLLLNAEVAQAFAFLGSFDASKTALAYHHHEESLEGESLLHLDAFMFREFLPSLVAQLELEHQKIIIYSFDWRHTEQWAQQSADLRRFASSQTKFVLSSHNGALLANHPHLLLNETVDFGHQFLRTLALDLNAFALVYPLESVKEDEWRAIVMRSASLNATVSGEQFVGDEIRIYGPEFGLTRDSLDKIRLLNAQFPIERVQTGEFALERLFPEPDPVFTPLVSLPRLLNEVVLEFADQKPLLSSVSATEGSLECLSEERRMISDFFHSIAARSS